MWYERVRRGIFKCLRGEKDVVTNMEKREISVSEKEIAEVEIVDKPESEEFEESLAEIDAFKYLVERDDSLTESDFLLDNSAKKLSCNGRPRKRQFGDALGGALRKLLNSTYCELNDGTTLTIADRLALETTAYTLKNPTPYNVKTLQEVAEGKDKGKRNQGQTTNITVVGQLLATMRVENDGGN